MTDEDPQRWMDRHPLPTIINIRNKRKMKESNYQRQKYSAHYKRLTRQLEPIKNG